MMGLIPTARGRPPHRQGPGDKRSAPTRATSHSPGAVAINPMAGSRHRRRYQREEWPPPCSEETTSQGTIALRQVAIAVGERSSEKTCRASSSTSTTASSPDVWAELLDSLLHQIIAYFSSFHDLLAFVGTCRPWRAALSSLPPALNFSFPPLHLQTNTSCPHPRRNYKYNNLSNVAWKLTDPAKRASSLRCSAPQNLQHHMRFLGCSRGYLIFFNSEQCVLVDAYCGADMRPPKLKSTRHQKIYYGILVATLNSHNSQLLLFSRSSVFQWQVGTNSWLDHPFEGEEVVQIVSFKGVTYAMDSLRRLHRICLAPKFTVQEVAVVCDGNTVIGLNFIKPWLVVCGDMLLLVDLSLNTDDLDSLSCAFEAFRLELSVEPARWVKVDNLGNCALFVSFDRRSPTFSSISPERWGGKCNCIYVANGPEDSTEAWAAFELGQAVPTATLWSTQNPLFAKVGDQLQSLWVLPSFVYGMGM